MSVKNTALFDFEDELGATRTVLERLPDEGFDWRPHERSWTLGELATHIASLPWWMETTITEDGFDVGGSSESPETQTDREGVLAMFDASVEKLEQAWDEATDETFDEPWKLRHGDAVLMEQPKMKVLRRFGLSHVIHHRAQLTVYLRMLDVPLPPLYGPTADEQQPFG
jgi:uncharacterized damage-inducible protein DinB